METVTIQMQSGPKEVLAELHGKLAVHQLKGREDWRVTHAPTGRAIAVGIAEKVDAVECARRLNEIHSWDFTDGLRAIEIIGLDVARRANEIGDECGGTVSSHMQ